MFEHLTLRGGAGTVLWGYREAVSLRAWRIAQNKKTKVWTLTGTPTRVDAFQARQRPLWFSAPRPNGFWMWGIESLEVGPTQIVARLGPPER